MRQMHDLLLRAHIADNTEIEMEWRRTRVVHESITLDQKKPDAAGVDEEFRLPLERGDHAIAAGLRRTHPHHSMELAEYAALRQLFIQRLEIRLAIVRCICCPMVVRRDVPRRVTKGRGAARRRTTAAPIRHTATTARGRVRFRRVIPRRRSRSRSAQVQRRDPIRESPRFTRRRREALPQRRQRAVDVGHAEGSAVMMPGARWLLRDGL
jgi:hypothetical protein